MYKIGFIGAGNMAFALAKAIKQAKLAKSIIASDTKEERLEFVKRELKIKVTTSNKEVIRNSDIVFLSVKPQVMDIVLDDIKDSISDQIIISIAAGIQLKKLESKLKNKKIVRVMPNTPCFVGEMAAGYTLGKKVSTIEGETVQKILSSAGIAIPLSEPDLDAVTGLSGSGPAFVARFIEALVQGGIKSGLSKETAEKLAIQTCLGTSKLLQTGIGIEKLVEMVSSPGGTTIAGREILENSDFKDIVSKTVQRATRRSKELGK
ncbi:MAG TPA: pyrroline-5-carboxylate reductase [Candidatus Nanoarchaeia archaeon]|nr:pyrroline-5-carboxylate reductase [Candidatus Nanoarchaeia archaeon]